MRSEASFADSEAPPSTGELTISVHYSQTSQLSPHPVRVDRKICGETRASQTLLTSPQNGLSNVVLWLEGSALSGWPKPQAQSPVSAKAVRVERCEISPRVVITRPQQILRIENLDPILYHFRSHARANPPFSRSHPPNLKAIEWTLSEPEIVPLECDIHPWVRAFIVVAPHPFYAVTQASGEAKFSRVPLGRYQLVGWHESLGRRDFGLVDMTSGKNQITWKWDQQ